jgi:hypothetical protein
MIMVKGKSLSEGDAKQDQPTNGTTGILDGT